MRTAVISLLATAAAAATTTTVVIEASHGGAGSGLTNNTITVPVGPVYTNKEAFAAVSTLYITSDDGVSCIPYGAENGQGTHGLAFTFGTPSRLSTNTVQVGSLVCTNSA